MKNQLITSQILDFFGSHQHFLITAARNFDGDAIGSAWALTLYLRSIGKTVTLANSLPLANVYHFLGCSKEIVQDFDESCIDAVIICDTGSISMLDELYKNHQSFFETTPTLNIDHHFAHCPFGSLCLLDPAATSTCNIVYDLILAHAGNTHCITPEIATALLLGLIYDTNCYKNNNSRARDFRLTAELIECGGAYYPSIIEYYRRRPFHHFQMYGAVLAQMTTRANGRIIFGWATQELLQQYHIGENELGNMFINDFLTSIEGDIFLYITELVEGGYKMSLRSKTETYDVSQLAKQYFYGGGHKFSSGGTCELTKREIEDIVEQYWIRCQ